MLYFGLRPGILGKPSEDGLGHESPPSQGISASSSEQQHLFSCGPSSTTVTVTATITKITDDEVKSKSIKTCYYTKFLEQLGVITKRHSFS